MIDIFQGTGSPVSASGFADAADKLGLNGSPAPLWAVLAVETRGFGYLPDRRPKILFERHIFHKRTGGIYSAANPDISNPNAGGYIGGAAEYQRLKRAMLLDRRAALESASWGLGQVMGFNASTVGYTNVEAMIEAFKESEDGQLDGCARFLLAKPDLHDALINKDWKVVAYFYNGKKYAANGYHTKLKSAYDNYTANGMPDVNARAAQACLAYLGFNPKGIDGVWGGGSTTALKQFQQSCKPPLPATGALDDAAFKALIKAAGV